MSRAYSANYKKRANTLSAKEPLILLCEISHSALSEPARVCDDNDDFPYSETLAFLATHAYALNEIVVPSQYNARYYKVTVAGTSAGSEPAWPTILTNTIVSGGVTFRCEGYQYKAMAFEATLPDDKAKQIPRAKLALDNVGRTLAPWLELSGGGEGAQARLMEVMRSQPTVIEWEVTMDLQNISMNQQRITGDLGFEDIMGRNAVAISYRPDVAPGLF